jgi:hypothetical protein
MLNLHPSSFCLLPFHGIVSATFSEASTFMTTYPTGQQPYMQQPPMSGPIRPASVTVIAIIGIVFGGVMLLCKPLGLAWLFVPQPNNPGVELQKQMMGWSVASGVLGIGLSLLLLVCSIGLLSLKPWARKGILGYAVLAVVMNVANLVVSLMWMGPMMEEIQRQQGPNAPAGMTNIMQTAGTGFAVVFFLITMIYPLVVWYYMTRPEIVGLFEGGGGPGFPAGPYAGPPGGVQAGGGYYAQPPGTYPPPRG